MKEYGKSIEVSNAHFIGLHISQKDLVQEPIPVATLAGAVVPNLQLQSLAWEFIEWQDEGSRTAFVKSLMEQ